MKGRIECLLGGVLGILSSPLLNLNFINKDHMIRKSYSLNLGDKVDECIMTTTSAKTSSYSSIDLKIIGIYKSKVSAWSGDDKEYVVDDVDAGTLEPDFKIFLMIFTY